MELKTRPKSYQGKSADPMVLDVRWNNIDRAVPYVGW